MCIPRCQAGCAGFCQFTAEIIQKETSWSAFVCIIYDIATYKYKLFVLRSPLEEEGKL